jgi:hypothetical protein
VRIATLIRDEITRADSSTTDEKNMSGALKASTPVIQVRINLRLEFRDIGGTLPGGSRGKDQNAVVKGIAVREVEDTTVTPFALDNGSDSANLYLASALREDLI